ncbi:uncharacterized protein PAC_07611 [Phialocephala subalpina]|uniref:Vacuolar h+-atpase assembly protein n=1 Tax=Phialocephala subalpina TaxID=576137 RepID=A0A1L7WY69_9HELO|nr:uncharacterized protein PAC_07611 [Phialocephala subalpina]
MVLLTITASMVEALEKIQSPKPQEFQSSGTTSPHTEDNIQNTKEQGTKNETADAENKGHEELFLAEKGVEAKSDQPTLDSPKIGNPITHGQVVDLSKQMKERRMEPCRLEVLLKGSRIYTPPPPKKAEPTSEYKALMAHLRRQEEARSYERMTNPSPPMETFAQRFPMASAAHAFPVSYQSIHTSDPDDDGTTYADIDRQMALVFNVLISIVACAAGIWIAARWWSTPARLALSMSGSMLVGVAEVVVYAGYIRRVGEAKKEERKVKEVKEIVNTWVVGADDEKAEETDPILLKSKEDEEDVKTRRRKKDIS